MQLSAIKPFMSVDILRMIYFSYVHSGMVLFFAVIHILVTAFLKFQKEQ